MTAPDWAALRRSAVGWAIQHGAGDDAEDRAHDALIRLLARAERYPGTAIYAAVHQAVRWAMADAAKSNEGRVRGAKATLGPWVPAPSHHHEDTAPWLALATDPAEYATITAWLYGLKSQDQVDLWPHLFPSVADAYRLRHRMVERLRRHLREESANAPATHA